MNIYDQLERTGHAYLKDDMGSTRAVAHKLLEAVELGRSQAANTHLANGELAKANAKIAALELGLSQHRGNTTTERIAHARTAATTQTLHNKAQKAILGKAKAVTNLRPAYKALREIRDLVEHPNAGKSIIGAIRDIVKEGLGA